MKLIFGIIAAVFAFASAAHTQPVLVTILLDTNKIEVGKSTTLHVYGQITADYEAETDRIFSWYLDLLNSTPNSISFNFASLARPESDRDPRTSSNGRVDGSNLRGIYDTFMAKMTAGHGAPVELFNITVTGQRTGTARFVVEPGSGVPNLAHDFIVAPEGGGSPLVGGEYTEATAALEVVRASSAEPVKLTITIRKLAGGSIEATLGFNTVPGKNHIVEFKDTLLQTWQPLPNAPHNSGSIVDSGVRASRFYRVRIE